MDDSVDKRRNLVILRAGAQSLHYLWLNNSKLRNWDLVVSVYDDTEFHHDSDIIVTYQRGGKWDGIYSYLQQSNALDKYDYIWLPDDDILTNCGAINEIFVEMRRLNLDIAQPSLSYDSYYTHFLALSCPQLRLRYTNFIEIMIPCLDARVLRLVLPDLSNSMSGFGMDPVWCRLSHEPAFKAAILDQISMRHTRPVGGGLHRMMQAKGRSPQDEASALLKVYDVHKKIRPLVYAMIDKDDKLILGKTHFGRFLLGIGMCIRYLTVYRECSFQEPAWWKLIQLLRRQAFEPLELWQIVRQAANPEAQNGV